MKRVKESFFREHPLWNNTEGCSGAKEFEGEDLGKYKIKAILNKIFYFICYSCYGVCSWLVGVSFGLKLA